MLKLVFGILLIKECLIDFDKMNSPDEEDKTGKETPNEQVDLAQDRTNLAEDRTNMANERTVLAHERTELAKQRNHLANERTFQAWIRTSLSLMGFGFIIEQFSIFLRANQSTLHSVEAQSASDYSWFVGVLLIALAIVMLITAYGRYRFIAKKIGYSKHFPSKWLTGLVVVCIAIGVLLLIYDLIVNL